MDENNGPHKGRLCLITSSSVLVIMKIMSGNRCMCVAYHEYCECLNYSVTCVFSPITWFIKASNLNIMYWEERLLSIRTHRTFHKTKRLQVQVFYFLECIASIFPHDMSILGKFCFFFLMPCNGGYYQNRASVRQTPVVPTASVLHTTLITKCTGGRFVQFY